MSYTVTVYGDFDKRDVLKSDSFDSMDEALTWASDEAWKLDVGEGVDQLEGTPDWIAEYDVLGTDAVVVVRESGLL